MANPWLLFDVNNSAHRMFYAMGRELDHSVTFGFLREVFDLQRRFQTNNVAFFFDKGKSKRKELFPGYKASRNAPDRKPEEVAARQEVQRQIKLLATEYLLELGFENVFHEKGYEADDLIASTCQGTRYMDFIIVSGDFDLYQCLSNHVSIWKAQKKIVYAVKDFLHEWIVDPVQWPYVKAMAGCPTDDVPGIRGVGEISACRFLRGEIKPESRIGKLIQDNESIWKRNLTLVRLPLPGTPIPKLVECKPINVKKWDALCKRLGMKSLLGHWGFAGGRK